MYNYNISILHQDSNYFDTWYPLVLKKYNKTVNMICYISFEEQY
jgi:hypothetical protein